MVKLTHSLREFLWLYHRDITVALMFGHVEKFTEEIKREYLEWCKTEEGRQYLKGGSKYKEDYVYEIHS